MSLQIYEQLSIYSSKKPPLIAKSQIINLAIASTTETALGPKTGSWRPFTAKTYF
jgi:hypothetical protein